MINKIILLAAILGIATSQNVYKCPSNWYVNAGFCYQFEADVPLSYDNARASCNLNGAGVLDVANLAENTFIVQWLQTNDPFQQEWYTSGVPDKTVNKVETGTGFIWDSTGEPVQPDFMNLWITPYDNTTTPKGVIIYTFGKVGPGWALGDAAVKRPYICKISEQESYRILLTDRDFSYGIANPDLANLEKGPHFVVQPQSMMVISQQPDAVGQNQQSPVEPVSLECAAEGNPTVTYRWYKGENSEQQITEFVDSRYAITNGKLTIIKPDEAKDSGKYQCVVENKFGVINSSQVEISFGSIGEFSNVPDAGTRGKAYEGATVQCSKIAYKPAASFQWYKGSNFQFIRPQYQTYIFISMNGNLYFSEITRNDQDDYTCLATLTGVSRYTIGTNQPPMRTSLPIPLIVDDQTPLSEWGPAIQNDFISVFPNPPLKGQNIRLECFAYGSSTSQFTYEWSREDKPMPSSAMLSDLNRVLTIEDALLEDSGVYRCTVKRGSQASDTRVIQLNLEAAPYFISELQDQHADIASQLTWICNARGNPAVTYSWYKNGLPLATNTAGNIKVQNNVLTINNLDATQHNGMYQCKAYNIHGSSLSNAQLRVLAIAPNINKYPPPSTILASNGGNITIRCQPEGSPFPTITWTKDGAEITSDGSKYTIFGNGNLHITQISASDKGVYTCKAVNNLGEAQASTTLDITSGAAITVPPSNQIAVVNRTVFIICEASFPPGIDMIYEWTFNGYPLFYDLIHFRQVQDGIAGTNGLYVLNAQFDHEGTYTCTARTPFNAVSKDGYLQVNGPPRQPAGVIAQVTDDPQSAIITWTAGSNSGGIITYHYIQASNEYEIDVWEDLLKVSVADSYRNEAVLKDKHQINVTGLNPGTGYVFRVIAQNEYGIGIPSDPSTMITTQSAPPRVFPNNVGGGGGSVGDLTMRWEPLKRSEYGVRDNSLKYKVYWRKKDENVKDAVWNLITVNDPTQKFTVTQVGPLYYYLPYETKIQAVNSMGEGPNSSIAEFMSAENLPIGVPENVNTNTFNSSCIEVYWDPVPDDRVHARGKILGYVINYWDETEDPNLYTRSIRYYGNVGYGLVIGLESQVNTIVDVQVYNSAGLGPRSNTYVMETARLPALHYSEEVRVSSAGFGNCRVWWRGITTQQIEEDITGFVIWLWTASENFLGAEQIAIPGRVFMTVLHNISEHRLYAMRIAATSFGGTGKKTPTVYFTTEGQILIDSSFAETIQAYQSTGTELSFTLTLLISSFVLLLLNCFHSVN